MKLLCGSVLGIGLLAGFAGIGAEEVRDPSLWPFDSRSLWNMPIGTEARYEKISGGLEHAVPGCEGHRPNLNTEAWSINVYFAEESDPPTLTQNWFGPAGDQFVGEVIPVPEDVEPSKGSDAHIAIVAPNRAFVYETGAVYNRREFGQLGHAGGVLNGWLWFENDLRGMGMGKNGGCHGTRASGFTSLGGLIRKGELQNGIRHALAAATSRANLNPNGQDGRSWVWPAVSSDYVFPNQFFPASEPLPEELAAEGWYKRKDGNLFIGSLLAIPAGVDVASLGLATAEGEVIARALQDYGAYIADMGDAPFILFGEPAVAGDCADLAGVIADLDRILPFLEIVADNTPETPGGAGARRVPMAPPIDPAFYADAIGPVDPGFTAYPRRPGEAVVIERK